MSLVLIVAAWLLQAPSQPADLWSHVGEMRHEERPITLSEARKSAVATLFRAEKQMDIWACGDDDPSGNWLQQLEYDSFPVAPGHDVVLVQAGAGCARGGQGANGAMWLVEFHGTKAVLLIGPKEGFGGWIYSIQSETSHGYRDFVTGWHMSASDAPLAYYRFDGHRYQIVGKAELKDGKIIPQGN